MPTHHGLHLKRIIYESKVHILAILLICTENELRINKRRISVHTLLDPRVSSNWTFRI